MSENQFFQTRSKKDFMLGFEKFAGYTRVWVVAALGSMQGREKFREYFLFFGKYKKLFSGIILF